jgi:putative transposase
MGVQHSRKAFYDWVPKADLQPEAGTCPHQVVLDETVIRINNQQFWLYAASDPQSNALLHPVVCDNYDRPHRNFPPRASAKARCRNRRFLADDAKQPQTALLRSGIRFQVFHNGNRNGFERIFRELKRRTSSFSNCFSQVELKTAKKWLQSFDRWHNTPN